MFDGGAVEQGFTGGPVSSALGGVMVEALQYTPAPGHPLRKVNSLPLVSLLARVSGGLGELRGEFSNQNSQLSC